MDIKNMPMLLSPKDVRKALNLENNQINQVYRLFNSKAFPSIRQNGKHTITKYKFLSWLGVPDERWDLE